MATLVLDRPNLEVRADGSALALYQEGQRRGTVPLKLLERVILQGSIRLDAGVLTRLAEAGAATLLLSPRHSRRLAVMLGPSHNDAAIRLAQSRLVLDTPWCTRWSRRQVMAKTRAQIRFIDAALALRPDCRKPLTDARDSLEQVFHTLRDSSPGPAVESVRGLEGAAARAYFRAIASLFAPSLGFSGRNRRPPRDPVNACLSLGYTLLHFDAVRAAHMAGLDPLLGFYHRPAFGRESLASDLIEPLRPMLDRWVWGLFRIRALREDHFSRDGQACLLGKTAREIFYRAYEMRAPALRRLLRRQCALLASRMKAQGEALIEPPDPADEDW